MSGCSGARVRAWKRQKNEDGAAALEFALVVPILLAFVFGIISYSYMFSVRQAITQAAAEGARAAAVASSGQSATEAVEAVNSALSGYGMTCGAGGLTCTPVTSSCGGESCMQVTVSYAYRANTPMPNLLPDMAVPATLAFTSSAEVN